MVFKRRQKATARTESEEEEERAAVTAYSGPASSTHQWGQNKSENPLKKLRIYGKTNSKNTLSWLWFCLGEKWICDNTIWRQSAEDLRVGGGDGPYRETWFAFSTGCEENCTFSKQKKRRRLYLIGCIRTCSWHCRLWLNCELKERGFKVVTGGIIDAPCRQEDPHLNNWCFYVGDAGICGLITY